MKLCSIPNLNFQISLEVDNRDLDVDTELDTRNILKSCSSAHNCFSWVKTSNPAPAFLLSVSLDNK